MSSGMGSPAAVSSLNLRSARIRRARTFSAEFGSPFGPSPTPGGKRMLPSGFVPVSTTPVPPAAAPPPADAASPGFMFRYFSIASRISCGTASPRSWYSFAWRSARMRLARIFDSERISTSSPPAAAAAPAFGAACFTSGSRSWIAAGRPWAMRSSWAWRFSGKAPTNVGSGGSSPFTWRSSISMLSCGRKGRMSCPVRDTFVSSSMSMCRSRRSYTECS